LLACSSEADGRQASKQPLPPSPLPPGSRCPSPRCTCCGTSSPSSTPSGRPSSGWWRTTTPAGRATTTCTVGTAPLGPPPPPGRPAVHRLALAPKMLPAPAGPPWPGCAPCCGRRRLAPCLPAQAAVEPLAAPLRGKQSAPPRFARTCRAHPPSTGLALVSKASQGNTGRAEQAVSCRAAGPRRSGGSVPLPLPAPCQPQRSSTHAPRWPAPTPTPRPAPPSRVRRVALPLVARPLRLGLWDAVRAGPPHHGGGPHLHRRPAQEQVPGRQVGPAGRRGRRRLRLVHPHLPAA
jgi:hypothetical protein